MAPPIFQRLIVLDNNPYIFVQSGNFDYPPASPNAPRVPPPSNPTQDYPTVTARLQHLRDLLDTDRTRERMSYQRARALETLDQELQEMDAEPLSQRLERRRRRVIARDRDMRAISNRGPAPRLDPEPVPEAPSNPVRSRRRPTRPSEILQRHRQLQNARQENSSIGLDQAAARIGEVSSNIANLNALLDEPVPRIGSPGIATQEHSGEAQVNRWRASAKRRKLDVDDTSEGFKGFNYGHFGQVVPGSLKMEIVSCDGGTYSEPNGDSSWPENVLLNDTSVYCTKSDRCNIILRHQGESPFCLKKLIIKAPKSGFDAPIQEGMVFISMTSDELLARTAQYQIQYSPSSRTRSHRHRHARSQPSHEYFNSFRSPLRVLERTVLTNPNVDHNGSSSSDLENGTHPTTNLDSLTQPASQAAPAFRVTTDFDDKSDDGDSFSPDPDQEDPFTPAAEIERMQLQQYDAEFLCSDDDDDDDSDENDEADMIAALNRGSLAQMRRRAPGYRGTYTSSDLLEAMGSSGSRRRVAPSLIEPTGPPAGQEAVVNGSTSAAGLAPEVMKPHARFFIEREKSMVSIKFNPPPSGRFILIKLWSPYSGGNIDIQSIVAHGFAGPRFFGALEFR